MLQEGLYTGGQQKYVSHWHIKPEGITDSKSTRIAHCIGPILEDVKAFVDAWLTEQESKKRKKDEIASDQ